MELLRIANGELAFGEDKILDKAELSIQTGERICLVGRNGADWAWLRRLAAGVCAPACRALGDRNRQGQMGRAAFYLSR